ncbi:SGNH/GDSL hydrolase family protein [Parafrankia sp. FMc2]|uniref:SGNH/GDSL hydrolase family protein n=1 Tax=Parafrankia sp. FMc2 TaxID=3233196 RepID=UPI0034D3923F
MPTKLRHTLLLDDVVIVFIDAVVATAKLMLDDNDSRPWRERIYDFELIFSGLDEERVQMLTDGLNKLSEDGNEIAARIKSQGYQIFVRRLVGTARYDRLVKALKSDGAVAILAARRVTRHIMPLALALDDCVVLLTPDQIARVEGLSKLNHSMLQLTLIIDDALEGVIAKGFSLESVPAREGEAGTLGADLQRLADQLHQIIEGRTRDALIALSARLARKIQGARDVLDTSADGVSQAANSLVEMLDRMLRNAFQREFVLEWVRREAPNKRDLTYVDHYGVVQPSKRGQALCLVYAGQPIPHPSPMHELAAMGVAEVRGALQKLKHADSGREEEIDEVRKLMAAIEGFITFTIQVGWVGVDEESLSTLRERLGA